jgi:hypothetical protein
MSPSTLTMDFRTRRLRSRVAGGASLLPKVAFALVAAFIVFAIGEPWLLFDAPPSPYEAVALRSLCRGAARPSAACPVPAADPIGVMAASATAASRAR